MIERVDQFREKSLGCGVLLRQLHHQIARDVAQAPAQLARDDLKLEQDFRTTIIDYLLRLHQTGAHAA